MKKILHPAAQRGHADHGWLRSAHSFSFGSYYDPEKVQFGALRVLNDDVIEGGSGFDPHGHANMEIVSVPLQGGLAHGDNQGHTEVIYPNDVQVMSAGTGIVHSEHNHSATEPGHFLQLWIIPEKQNVSPRYAQHTFDPKSWHNQIATLVTSRQQEGTLWIHQQATIARTNLDPGKVVNYTLQAPAHGVYAFVIEGQVRVAEELLNKRDGLGITEVNQVALEGVTPCDVLLIEVPMQVI